MEKKSKLSAFMTEAGKKAKDAFGGVVQTMDQNSDGKLDLKDISIIADTVGSAVKKGAQSIKENANEKARQAELKALQPIFEDSLDASDFSLPKLIRIANPDKKHMESELCKDSVGYISDLGDLHVVNLYTASLALFGISFFPDYDCGFYYINPVDRDQYIALEEYFTYLKTARVNELQRIAQDLGAKYFRVIYKEEQTSNINKNDKMAISLAANSTDVERKYIENRYSHYEVAAEMEFPGHNPMVPEVKYLKNDVSIQNLIALRMNATSPLQKQKLLFKMSNSCGIKESEGVKIDMALKKMNFSGKMTVAGEINSESHRYLEYEILF